jgi:hypothetical protein
MEGCSTEMVPQVHRIWERETTDPKTDRNRPRSVPVADSYLGSDEVVNPTFLGESARAGRPASTAPCSDP